MKTIFSDKNTASKNMTIDAQLLKDLRPSDPPILHFYEFSQPAATHGLFLKPEEYLTRVDTLDVAKRPTGGGVLFHMWDHTFSLLIPSGHALYSNDTMLNYKRIHEIVLEAVREFTKPLFRIHLMSQDPMPLYPETQHYCFAKPTQFDVMIAGKKVAGAAQRRKRNGFLHQGSISVAMPDFEFLEELLPKQVIEGMKLYTYAPLPAKSSKGQIEDAKKTLTLHLQKAFSTL